MEQKKLQNVSIPSSSSNSTNIQHKLQSIIQNQYQQLHNNWAYAIFWNLTTTHHSLQPFFTWGDSFFQPHHHHLQATTPRELTPRDGDILTNAIRSNEVVWLNDHRQFEESTERAKQLQQRYGIQTLVFIPMPNGAIEFGSPFVITQDTNLVEQVNAEFGLSVAAPPVADNSTDINYAETLEELDRRYSSLRSVVPNVSRLTDKADVLSNAVSYINELQMRIEELQSQIPRDGGRESSDETEATSREKGRVVEVEVKMIGEEEAVIRVESKNLRNAGARLMEALRDLGLKVQHGSMSNLQDAITLQTVVVGVPIQLGFNHEAIKQQLITILHH